jgi:hypothetical protein
MEIKARAANGRITPFPGSASFVILRKSSSLKGRLVGLLLSSIDTMVQSIEKALQAKSAWFGVKAALLSNLAQTPKGPH